MTGNGQQVALSLPALSTVQGEVLIFVPSLSSVGLSALHTRTNAVELCINSAALQLGWPCRGGADPQMLGRTGSPAAATRAQDMPAAPGPSVPFLRAVGPKDGDVFRPRDNGTIVIGHEQVSLSLSLFSPPLPYFTHTPTQAVPLNVTEGFEGSFYTRTPDGRFHFLSGGEMAAPAGRARFLSVPLFLLSFCLFPLCLSASRVCHF